MRRTVMMGSSSSSGGSELHCALLGSTRFWYNGSKLGGIGVMQTGGSLENARWEAVYI